MSIFDLWRRKSGGADLEPAEILDPEIALLSDVGCHRPVNQDTGRVTLPADEARRRARGVLIAVADGMGGQQGGELASQWAIEVISRVYYERNGDLTSDLVHAFQEANRHIHKNSIQDESLHGMGTTCTALVLHNGQAHSGHVGDSRLYLVRGGEIYLMTEDHSAVMELVKQGVLTLEEARHHTDRNVINRALGTRSEVEVDTWNEPLPLKPGDHFLICSDGLYERVEDAEMKDAILSQPPPEACQALIDLAKQRGGYDNITVAVARVEVRGNGEKKIARETREVEVQA
ncbi:MAG TPA: Stp1/IreP family PP2C-type Ser/Thr phosphatase [Bryobacteraceae bacterium]|nr:Stp1/IreP family PP2C-type Ser/Thr phosphatase [Bryobacteraceae bacterium]